MPNDDDNRMTNANSKPAKGITRLIKATGYSFQGLYAAFRYEAAIRQEVNLLLIAIPVLLVFDFTYLERLMLLGTVILVLIVELLNSAIEAVVDRVGVERHELSGRAKDIGSAAVFVSLLFAVITWVTIFYHHFFL